MRFCLCLRRRHCLVLAVKLVVPRQACLDQLEVHPFLTEIHIAEDTLVAVHLIPLHRDSLAKNFLREELLGLGAEWLAGLGAVNVLKANLVLLVALEQYGNGVAVSYTQ